MASDLRVDIGKRVRALREARPGGASGGRRRAGRRSWMTIEDLAVAAGLSVDYVNKVELGRHMPTAETLVRIAAALDVPVSELFPDGDARATAKREALDRLRAFAAAFSAAEIGYMVEVLRAIMKRHR